MDRPNILQKIRKLLDVVNAKSVANLHEAENALRLAQKLMIEYNVSEVECQSGLHVEIGVVGRYFVKQGRRTLEDKFVVGTIVRFFSVRVIWRGTGNMYVVGTETNLDIAENVYWYLRRAFYSLWRKYYYEMPKWERDAKLKQPYYNGLLAGLREKLERGKKEAEEVDGVGSALMVVNRSLDIQYRMLFPAARRSSSSSFVSDHGSYHRGKNDSQQLNINKGIVAGGSTPALS